MMKIIEGSPQVPARLGLPQVNLPLQFGTDDGLRVCLPM